MPAPQFSPEQLLWLAIIVSGGKGEVQTAAAVAGAESNGRPDARNVNTDQHRSIDRGLWQINSYWHSEVSDDCAYRALCNARNAYRISNGWRDFSAWSTYTGGLYLNHFPPASALPVPIAEPALSRFYAPSGWTAPPPLQPGGVPFGHPGIVSGGTPSGEDYSPKVIVTGRRAGVHGSSLNDAANAIHRLASGRRLPS